MNLADPPFHSLANSHVRVLGTPDRVPGFPFMPGKGRTKGSLCAESVHVGVQGVV